MYHNENGVALMEELVSIALLILAISVFAVGLSVGNSGVGTVHKRVSSENLARIALEQVKSVPYESGAGAYVTALDEVPISVPGYSLSVASQELETHLQLITVTVMSGNDVAFVMEEYKRGP